MTDANYQIRKKEYGFGPHDREPAVMMLITLFLLLILAPEFAIAQEMASKENVTSNPNERATAPQSPTDRHLHTANVDPANNSIIELNALYAKSKFMADPDLYSEIKQSDRSEPGVIGDWRERVFKILRMYYGSRRSDLANDGRLPSNNDLDEQANERKTATKIVLKETLKFTQERLPEFDKLVKAMKLEVSNRTSTETAEAEANDKKTGEERAAKNSIDENRFFIKTGLRIPVDNGKLGLVSETEARYRKVSYFFKVKLDGQYDNSLSLTYILGKDIDLQVERQVTHMTDPITRDETNAKSSLNLIQLVCKF